MSLSKTGTLWVRSISGVSNQIEGLSPSDPLETLHSKVASTLNVTSAEVRLCNGLRSFTEDDLSSSLRQLGLTDIENLELAVLRIPRLTPEVLEGNWMNTKGTRVRVSGLSANMAGLVTYDLKLDDQGTVVGVGDHLRVKGLSGSDVVSFTDEKWWRVREEDCDHNCIVVFRTVGGACKRVESLRPSDTLSVLRACAAESFKEALNLHNANVDILWGDKVLSHALDSVSISDIGLPNGVGLLVVK